MNETIINLYKETYSVSEVMRQIKMSRGKITKILKDADVYEGLSGPNYVAKKQELLRAKMQEKYGVDNISQAQTNSLIERNKIPYDSPQLLDDLEEYTRKVRRHTKNIFNRKNVATPPEVCYYTGIKFNDVLLEEVNPNDPYKRTVDHKHPILQCYLDGWSVEDAGGEDNLIFVLRVVNSIKSNTPHESFLPIAEQLKERLMHK